jgi:phospholipid/cholesterol/gamma-HCH transport system substrate-binding protein
MKISNEVKVGILAIAAIVVLVIGFNFLKGNNVFSKPAVLYARFADIGTLDKSNQVKINGLPIGTVYNITQADNEVDTILVEIHLTRDIKIPKNSVAFIDGSVLGSAYINIEKQQANTGQYLKSGDTISTRLEPGLMVSIQTQLAPTLTRVNQTLDTLKIAIGSIAAVFDPGTKNNLQTLVAHLTVSSAELSNILRTQSAALGQALQNVNSVTENLARNNDAVTSSIRNVEVTTSKLANANIEGVVAALQATINELKGTVSNINSNKGTLGLLMNDRKLYDDLNGSTKNLNRTLLSMEILLDDIRLHPKRYLNISLFGGGNKGEPITSPGVKDTIPKK